MEKFIKYYLSVLFIIGMFVININQVNAEEVLSKRVLLDENTIERGYTVTTNDELVKIGIQPDTFFEPAWVKIKKVENEELNLPANKQLASDVYVYDVRVANPIVLGKLVWVSLYSSTSGENKSLAFYNRVTDIWQEVPTTFVNNHARSGLPFPYSKIAVLEDKTPDIEVDLSEPEISAIAGIVIDEETGEVLFSKNSNEVRPIASLTKIMTAWVFLDQDPNFTDAYTYNNNYETNPVGAHLYIVENDVLTIGDVYYSMLVGSANNAAKMIGYNTPDMNFGEFVAEMNTKADELGLDNTTFVEPSGLNVNNVSTAYEYALLARQAFKKSKILQGTTLKSYYFDEISSADWRKNHNIINRNQLLSSDLYITGTKTGYLDESGYCYVIRVKDRDTNNEVIAVTLGNSTRTERWADAEALVNYGLSHLNSQE